jgi:uncharacterized protein (TIGR03382 family)
MKTRRRAAAPRSGRRRLARLASVSLPVLGLLLASVAAPQAELPPQENAPAATPPAAGSATHARLLIAPSPLGTASPPGAAVAATPTQIRAAVAAVNALLLVPEPAPAASGATSALALALLAGGRLLRRRS